MRSPRAWSTGLQLTVLIVALLLASYLVAGWIALRVSTGEQVRQIDRSLDESVSGARELLDTLSAEQVRTLRSVPSAIGYAIVDRDGTPATDPELGQLGTQTLDLSTLGANTLLARVGDPFTFGTADGRTVRVLIVPTDGGYLAGLTSFERVQSSEDRLATQLFLVGVAVSATVGLLTWGGVNTILAPLRTMITNARHISRGVPGITLDLRHGATEVRELGRSLDDMRSALTASSERTRRFAADASHDLRTPLSIIRSRVQLHRSGATTDSDPWDDIERSVDRMEHLVADLLFLSRSETLDPTRSGLVDLAEVVDEAVTAHRTVDPDRTYAWSRPGHPSLVDGDEQQLRRVIDNVLGNVSAHTPTGTRTTIEIDSGATEVTCTFADDGPGLTPDQVARATDRFWRADRARTTTGSGLGLAIASAVATSHRGRLDVSPGRAGTGLRVSITLPLAPPG